jgi:hypothetical protein
MSPSDHRRPLAAPGGPDDPDAALAALEALEAERAPRFAAVADLKVDTGGVVPEDVVLAVLDALPPDLQVIGRARRGPGAAPARPPRGHRPPDSVRSPGRAAGP